MIFFEKITKCIAFARDFRYTVKRIAPATCRFCALLPKQPTPRQGTKTNSYRKTRFLCQETTYTPSGDENSFMCFSSTFFSKKQPTPRQGTKTDVFEHFLNHFGGETTYTPSGDENPQRYFHSSPRRRETTYAPSGDENSIADMSPNISQETTYTPPGDENRQARNFLKFFSAKQLTPRQGTKTST